MSRNNLSSRERQGIIILLSIILILGGCGFLLRICSSHSSVNIPDVEQDTVIVVQGDEEDNIVKSHGERKTGESKKNKKKQLKARKSKKTSKPVTTLPNPRDILKDTVRRD